LLPAQNGSLSRAAHKTPEEVNLKAAPSPACVIKHYSKLAIYPPAPNKQLYTTKKKKRKSKDDKSADAQTKKRKKRKPNKDPMGISVRPVSQFGQLPACRYCTSLINRHEGSVYLASYRVHTFLVISTSGVKNVSKKCVISHISKRNHLCDFTHVSVTSHNKIFV